MALGADLRQGAQYNEAPEGAGRPKKDTPRKGVAVTKKAADQTADKPEPPAKSWLEKDRLSVVFPGWQRDYAAEIEALLQASPAAEKPMTPAAVVGMIFELSQAHAVHLGLVVDPPVKTAAEVLGEGRAALSGEGPKSGAGSDAAEQSAAGGSAPVSLAPVRAPITAQRADRCHFCSKPTAVKDEIVDLGEGRYAGSSCCREAEAAYKAAKGLA